MSLSSLAAVADTPAAVYENARLDRSSTLWPARRTRLLAREARAKPGWEASGRATTLLLMNSPAVEVKRTLDGKVLEYPCKSVLFEPGVRAVILCEIAEPEPVVGGRLTLEPGTRSYGYFWLERPYVPYHWLVDGTTMLHYVNLGRVVSLERRRVVWDDYAVDVLVWPGGHVEIVDEEEIPPATDASILTFIADAKTRLLDELDDVVALVERETRQFEAR
jgi:hypothetical protein